MEFRFSSIKIKCGTNPRSVKLVLSNETNAKCLWNNVFSKGSFLRRYLMCPKSPRMLRILENTLWWQDLTLERSDKNGEQKNAPSFSLHKTREFKVSDFAVATKISKDAYLLTKVP